MTKRKQNIKDELNALRRMVTLVFHTIQKDITGLDNQIKRAAKKKRKKNAA